MKKIKTVISLLLILCLSISLLAIPAGAAAAAPDEIDLSEAQKLMPLNSATFSDTENGTQEYLFRITLKDAGKIRFYNTSAKVGSSSRIALLYSDGRTALKGKYSDVIGKIMYIAKKGTYYVKVTLTRSQSVRGFGYTYISDSGKRVTKRVAVDQGKKYSFSSYVKTFSGTRKWTTSDSSVIKISSKGIGTVVGTGKATIRVYSSNGDYAQITVRVREEGEE